jgi:hypothetical protein
MPAKIPVQYWRQLLQTATLDNPDVDNKARYGNNSVTTTMLRKVKEGRESVPNNFELYTLAKTIYPYVPHQRQWQSFILLLFYPPSPLAVLAGTAIIAPSCNYSQLSLKEYGAVVSLGLLLLLIMPPEGQSYLLLGHNHQALPHLVRHVLHVWLSTGGKDVGPGPRVQDQPSQASTAILALATWTRSSLPSVVGGGGGGRRVAGGDDKDGSFSFTMCGGAKCVA